MKIDRDEVRRIAELARLEIADGDAEAVAGQLSGVLDFVATLRQLDLEGCEPSTFAPPSGGSLAGAASLPQRMASIQRSSTTCRPTM